MKPAPRQDEPAQRTTPAPERGAPSTYAAHASRKDLTVRVSLRLPASADNDDLGEHGYGHGV